MTQAIIAYGATVERSQDGTTYTEIPEVKGVAVPQVQQEYVEATHLQSPNGFREYVKGLKDAGELSVPANYTTAGYQQQLDDQDFNGTIKYRVTLPLAPGQTSGESVTVPGASAPASRSSASARVRS